MLLLFYVHPIMLSSVYDIIIVHVSWHFVQRLWWSLQFAFLVVESVSCLSCKGVLSKDTARTLFQRLWSFMHWHCT